jgi:hypothetical protein
MIVEIITADISAVITLAVAIAVTEATIRHENQKCD